MAMLAVFSMVLTQDSSVADRLSSRAGWAHFVLADLLISDGISKVGMFSPLSEALLYTFRSGEDGISPYSALIADRTGALYGTTTAGGAIGLGHGAVFKLTPIANGYHEDILYRFHGPDGQNPQCGLIADSSGALYGTTAGGGTAGDGTVYKLTPNGNGYIESVLYSFKGGADGSVPIASLIADASGALYGTTRDGGYGTYGFGTVFKLSPKGSGYVETVIYSFPYTSAGGLHPYAALLADKFGNLFGTTNSGGSVGLGTVFELTPKPDGSYAEAVIYSFPGDARKGNADGESPQSALIADGTGALFGTTFAGGSFRHGAVFKLYPYAGGYLEAVLYSFRGGDDGADPRASLVGDGAGGLYGTTGSGGGRLGYGTVFKLTPGSNGYSENVLYRFTGGADGSYPFAALMIDGSGSLLGTTFGGNPNNWGSVFKLKPQGTEYSESTLHSFHRQADGAYPSGPLIEDSTGALYGTTYKGGTTDQGTVFKLVRKGSGYGEAVLYRFQHTPGAAYPPAGVIADNAGALYGTSYYGGTANLGTVFKLIPTKNGYVETVLHSFQGVIFTANGRPIVLPDDGSHPYARLISDGAGALFGTTMYGGSRADVGTVFKLTANGNAYQERVVYTFQGNAQGANPSAGVLAGNRGALFGTTFNGGTAFKGTVFKLSPRGGIYSITILHSFTGGSDGQWPLGDLIADSSGSLYGTTAGDEQNSFGTVFKLTPNGNGYSYVVLHVFGGPGDGATPAAGVIADSTGALYGTTASGGSKANAGTVFKLTPNGNAYSESVLYSFQGGTDGSGPLAPLIADSTGALFGTTQVGGKLGVGTVFKLIP
jgi:uncharacterized repeat protein (TIGR03803 family)